MTEHLVHQDGAHVRAGVGDRIVIRLEEPGTAGYQWSITALPDLVVPTGERLLPSGSAAPGAVNSHEFSLDVTGRGSGMVSLELRRPWETGSPERTAHIDVTVG